MKFIETVVYIKAVITGVRNLMRNPAQGKR